MPNTVRLHRVLATKPEKIYRAFIEPDAMAKWLRRAGPSLAAADGSVAPLNQSLEGPLLALAG